MIQPACTDFQFPDQGYYQASVVANFASIVTTQTRILKFDLNGVNAAQVNVNVIGAPSLSLSNVFHISDSASEQMESENHAIRLRLPTY